MGTSAAPAGATTQALVRHDPRPFLVQAIDRALETGAWNVADVEAFTIDIVNMAFRYLNHRRQDVRDLDAVGEATEIVLMFIDDGLRTMAQGDVDRAAGILASEEQSLLTAFRASWGELDQLRRRAQAEITGLHKVRIGPPGQRIAIGALPETLIQFGSERGLYDYTDPAALAAWHAGASIASLCARLRTGLALAQRQYELLLHLPFDEVTRRWRELILAEGTFVVDIHAGFAYDVGWTSACIRAVTRGDVGLVVTADDLERFLADHLRTNDEGRRFVSEEALEAAARVLAPPLSAALGRSADDDVRYALDHITVTIVRAFLDADEENIAPRSGQWFIAWGLNAVFLAATRQELARAIEAVVAPMEPDELVARFESVTTPAGREKILRQLDVVRLPIAEVARLIEASEKRARRMLRQAKLEQRSIQDLEELAMFDFTSTSVRYLIAKAILAACADFSRSPDEVVLALSCELSIPEEFRDLLSKARMTPERLLKAFRQADNRRARQEWTRLAAASPKHLTHLIGDARSMPEYAIDIAAPFQQRAVFEDAPWISAGHTASCFLDVEQVMRRRSRARSRQPLLNERGEPIILDPDLLWLWGQLPDYQRETVCKAFRKASRSAPVRRIRKRKAEGCPRRAKRH